MAEQHDPQSAGTERARRRNIVLAVVGAAAVFLVLAAFLAGLSYNRYRVSPQYAIDRIAEATASLDMPAEPPAAYVDMLTIEAELDAAYETLVGTAGERADYGSEEFYRSMRTITAIGNVPSSLGYYTQLIKREPITAEVATLVPIPAEGSAYDEYVLIELRMRMERRDENGKTTWRMTHALNAEEFVLAAAAAEPNSEMAESLSE